MIKKSKDDEELAEWINKSIRNSLSKSSDWRQSAKESYDFYAGRQWDEEVSSKLASSGRVPIVFNRVARAINAVSGMQRQNRQESAYLPREVSDSGLAEEVSDIARWVKDNTDAEDEESEMFEDNLICGMGWTEMSMSYDLDPEGLIKEDRIDPLEMGWDMTATKRNLLDRQYQFRIKKISKKDFNTQWPGVEIEPWDIVINLDSDDPHDATEAKFYKKNQTGPESRSKTVQVAQFQWWEKEASYKADIMGKAVVMDGEQHKVAKADLEALGVDITKTVKRHYYQAFFQANNILEVGDAPCEYDFSFQCCTGFRDRKNNTWFGLVELMKDPQRYANKWLSQIVYILSVNSKGGLMAEKDAFANIQQAEQEWSSADAITWMNPGGIDKVKEKTMAAFPSGLDQLLGYAMEAISDVAGVNQELMGVAGREQSGYLESQRKQAGLTILATFFDSFRRYTKNNGRLLINFVKDYIPEGRLVRIGSAENAQYIPLVKDKLSYTFDIVVNDSPTSPNMKEKIFSVISSLMPVLVPNGYPIPEEVLDYSPLPTALIAAWKKKAQPPPPDPEAIILQKTLEQLQVQGLDATNKKTTAQVDQITTDARLNQAKAINEMQNANAPVPGMDAKDQASVQEIVAKTRLLGAKALTELRNAHEPYKQEKPDAPPEQMNSAEVAETNSKTALNTAKAMEAMHKASAPHPSKTPPTSKGKGK